MSETPDWAKGAVSTLNPTAKAQVKPKPRSEWSEYDMIAEQMINRVRDGLFSMAMLVQPTQFMHGGPGHFINDHEWMNQKGTFDLRAAVEARISELGLSPELVHAYPTSRMSVAEEHHFLNLSFEDRISKFRVAA